MSTLNSQEIKEQSHRILEIWLESCTRHGKISRNTIAIGMVVLDHLRHGDRIARSQVLSQGGEISGARSGLRSVLQRYGISPEFLKEVTTRQGHQDGQRLFEQLNWGQFLAELSAHERDQLVLEMIEVLKNLANVWLSRQNLKLDVNRRNAPTTWIRIILENASGRSGGVVEQQLIGAKLARRLKGQNIPNHPVHAADIQTDRTGDFVISKLVYHVTASPSRGVLQKCAKNLNLGLQPILLVPGNQEDRARILAQEESIADDLTIISIESYVATNILELATEDGKDLFTVLQEIVEIYNERLAQVETDMSLMIEVR